MVAQHSVLMSACQLSSPVLELRFLLEFTGDMCTILGFLHVFAENNSLILVKNLMYLN